MSVKLHGLCFRLHLGRRTAVTDVSNEGEAGYMCEVALFVQDLTADACQCSALLLCRHDLKFHCHCDPQNWIPLYEAVWLRVPLS